MTVPQITLCAHLPQLLPLKSLEIHDGDVLVHSPGFEDRTLGVINALPQSRGLRCVFLDYRPVNPRNRLLEVRNQLRSLGACSLDEDIVLYDRFDPADFESRLRNRLALSTRPRVILDISTMSKLAILLALGICNELDANVRVIYTEAATYGPSLEEFRSAKAKNEIHRPSLQIFDGVHGVVRVSSLSSVAMQGQPTAALVFMSFNNALTQVLLNTVYPSRLFLINGKPPVHSWREEATAWIHDQVRCEWEEDNPVAVNSEGVEVPIRSVSTLDYRDSVALLVDLYWQLSSNHRVLLAPAGSKMQALGCWLAKSLHPDIHVEYPSPEGFQPEYSSGISRQWCLNLGRVQTLLTDLAAEERRTYLELSAAGA